MRVFYVTYKCRINIEKTSEIVNKIVIRDTTIAAPTRHHAVAYVKGLIGYHKITKVYQKDIDVVINSDGSIW